MPNVVAGTVDAQSQRVLRVRGVAYPVADGTRACGLLGRSQPVPRNLSSLRHLMKTSLHFLIEAKRCEMADLQRLMRTSSLVDRIAGLVHVLQRERGLTNLHLASGGSRGREALAEQRRAADHHAQAIRAAFDALADDAPTLPNGTRLFARVAYALQGLAALERLRQRIDNGEQTPTAATAAYSRLIEGLLGVVFEAADSAADPTISRHLVASFNFSQGKEFAGQERAVGVAAFASGRATSDVQQRLLYLIESQDRCLSVFAEFSSERLRTHWQQAQQHEVMARLERLRRVLLTTPPGQALDPADSQRWFDACTQRLDAMRGIEAELFTELRVRCQDRLDAAAAELGTLVQRLSADCQGTNEPDEDFFAEERSGTQVPAAEVASTDATLAPQVGRSVLELVRTQTQRLQTMSAELDAVRASLNERKLIERAKGLLMAHRHLSEDEAHRMLRETAMNQNKRMVDVAEAVLAMANVLQARSR
ncbi:Nitrate regulatory protein [Tepidimonas thermarum]|uniref:Nitrate regulatory protein n=2 Tax=Tepidimonas thermarum TaxID=335431 RepID=A0A554WUB7_9BURK|nr:Nitrate regulatory protein [Tepidimonas thermarum]